MAQGTREEEEEEDEEEEEEEKKKDGSKNHITSPVMGRLPTESCVNVTKASRFKYHFSRRH